MEKEIWKDIPNYEGLYQASSLGKIKSLDRNKYNSKTFIKGKILKLSNVSGYLMVGLTKNGFPKNITVHVLIAMTFLGHKPDGTHKVVVDHINNIKTDNRLCNLQLISNRENLSKDRKNKSSKYTGVSWDKFNDKWRSDIKINGLRKNLGRYKCEIVASIKYDIALKNFLNAS